jgi:hypothetical protein
VPVIADASPLVAPELMKDLPTASDSSTNVLMLNKSLWAENGEGPRKRFRRGSRSKLITGILLGVHDALRKAARRSLTNSRLVCSRR